MEQNAPDQTDLYRNNEIDSDRNDLNQIDLDQAHTNKTDFDKQLVWTKLILQYTH